MFAGEHRCSHADAGRHLGTSRLRSVHPGAQPRNRRVLKRLRMHDGEPPRSGTARAQGSTTSWIRPWRT
jgi:hypothetical protein